MTDRLSEIAQRLEAANRQQWFAIDMRFLLSEVSRLQQENAAIRELLLLKTQDIEPRGKTILDFYAVWHGQDRGRISRLESELSALRSAPPSQPSEELWQQPSVCRCRGNDEFEHKHYAEPPHRCALCLGCEGFTPVSAPPSGIPKEPSVEAILAATRSDDLSHEDCPCPVHHTGPCFYTCVAKSLRAAYRVDASSPRTHPEVLAATSDHPAVKRCGCGRLYSGAGEACGKCTAAPQT